MARGAVLTAFAANASSVAAVAVGALWAPRRYEVRSGARKAAAH